MPPQDYNATLLSRTDVAAGLAIVRVALNKPDLKFEAGQYIVLGLKRSAPRVPEAAPEEPPASGPADPEKMILRAYSIASSSRPGEYLEFYLTMVASGELTPRLFALKPNDRLYVGPKATGLFTLDAVPPEFHVLLVGTGTGLAPYMSMLRSHSIAGTPRKYIVLHGARYASDLGYRMELEALARTYPNLRYMPVVSRPGENAGWTGLNGHLQNVLFSGVIERETGLDITPANFHVFLCGNPGMIEAAKARLLERGFVQAKGRNPGTIHIEEYW